MNKKHWVCIDSRNCHFLISVVSMKVKCFCESEDVRSIPSSSCNVTMSKEILTTSVYFKSRFARLILIFFQSCPKQVDFLCKYHSFQQCLLSNNFFFWMWSNTKSFSKCWALYCTIRNTFISYINKVEQ